MKKIITLLVTLLVLFGCSSSKEIKASDLDDIKSRGYMIVAMEGTWAPWTYHNEKGDLVGYDVEIGKKIGECLGVEVRFVEGAWDGLLAGIETGRYDMMINGCGVTPERQQSYDFSNAYAYDKVAVIVRADNDEITKMEDLNGKRTANTISSTYAQIATEYGAAVSGVDDLNQTFLLLDRGDIDATLNAEVSYIDYMKANPDKQFKIACYYENAPEIAIAMKKNSSALVNEVNKALDQMRTDGSLKELSNKYFGIDITTPGE